MKLTMKSNPHRYHKPTLIGGSSPEGLEWTPLLTNRHSRVILRSLSFYRKVPTSEILIAALRFYEHNFKQEVNLAYADYSNRYEPTHE